MDENIKDILGVLGSLASIGAVVWTFIKFIWKPLVQIICKLWRFGRRCVVWTIRRLKKRKLRIIRRYRRTKTWFGYIFHISDKFSEYNKNLEKVASTIANFDNTTKRLENQAAGLSKRVDGYSLKNAELERGVGELRKDVLELDKKVEAYGYSFNGITAQTTNLKDEISELREKFDAYSAIIAAYEKRIRTLEEALKRVESPLESWDVAEAGARRVLTYKGIEFAFRYCPAGSFTMGSPSSESGRWDNETQREVSISEGFWISETPTTQEQWKTVGIVKSNECSFKGGKLPVENVTWHESDAFIKKLNELGLAPEGWLFALPSEEQWEYACRAGTTGSTYGVPLGEAAWYDDNSGNQTHEVWTKKPNNWGVYDMLGNVWEWTSSRYNGGSSFVFRGGGWCSDAQRCRLAGRDCLGPSFCGGILGFRLVLVRSQSR